MRCPDPDFRVYTSAIAGPVKIQQLVHLEIRNNFSTAVFGLSKFILFRLISLLSGNMFENKPTLLLLNILPAFKAFIVNLCLFFREFCPGNPEQANEAKIMKKKL